MRTPKNHFKMGVSFPHVAYSIENRKDVEITPADVLQHIEDFAARIRRDLQQQKTDVEKAD